MSENGFTVIKQNDRYIDSRKIAEITGKRHGKIIRVIEKCIKTLIKSKIYSPNISAFFIENSYKTAENDDEIYYLLTKNGCEIISSKLAGNSGILFRAAYISSFSGTEQQAKTIPLTVPANSVMRGDSTYNVSDIAEICGVMSVNGKLHPRAVGAILSILGIGGERFDEHTLNSVKRWLKSNRYPRRIRSGLKTYAVNYTLADFLEGANSDE